MTTGCASGLGGVVEGLVPSVEPELESELEDGESLSSLCETLVLLVSEFGFEGVMMSLSSDLRVGACQ